MTSIDLELLLVALGAMLSPTIANPGDSTQRRLAAARGWLERNTRNVAAVILVLLAGSLLSHGIAGLTS